MPYKSIYRCISCSGQGYTNPDGVFDFATRGPRQTIPVSHFGDIEKAKIWLILTNPIGAWNDTNVGHLVSSYQVTGRENLTDKNIDDIFHHFSSYFQRPGVHPFFIPYMNLLDGLIVGDHACSFQNGGICAVDVIKCPTRLAFKSFIINNPVEGELIWHNCLERVKNPGPNDFILKQIRRHNPPVLIFAQSTSGLIGQADRGHGNGTLQGFGRMRIFTRNQHPGRLSISLGGNQLLMQALLQNPRNLKNAIQQAISAFF